jgi:UDP-2,3-diacylglucosamine pyrophosphatase LpxH
MDLFIQIMEEEESTSFIVLSDTHLGLRAGKRLYFFYNYVDHRPTHVDQFVKWLEKLQNESEIELPFLIEESDKGEPRKIGRKKLLFPDKLVLNGDIFELWDTSDQSIQFASYSILSSISRLGCEKFYTIGNHDFANAELAIEEEREEKAFSNVYPWGLSNLNILRDTYPLPKDGVIRTLKAGEDHYLIVHGHQFNRSFRLAPWKIISTLRDGAEAFRLYSWVLLGLWIIWLAALPFISYLGPNISSSIQYAIGLPLTVLAIPRLFVSIARPIWNKLFGSRYDRNKAPRGFVEWWKIFTKKYKLQTSRIRVIYGHTHAIDVVEKPELEIITGKNIGNIEITLINHPAWVKDKQEVELREAFVYVDKSGFEFFGWNWDDLFPFHIPKSVVRTYAFGKPIDDDTAEKLIELRWPKNLVEALKKSGSKNPKVVAS